jgi:drug/metabolite transporter (DMT)-like permease
MTAAAPLLEDRRNLGIGLLIAAQLFFAILDTSAKWLAISGLATFEIVFVRYLVPLTLLLVFLLPSRGLALFRTGNLKLEILRGLCLAGVTGAMFFAMKFLPLTVTGSLLFTMPLIVSALSGPMLGEKVGWRRWLAIVVGFIGILIIVRPGTAAFHPASLVCLAGAVCAAFYGILTRKLAGIDPASTQTVYGSLVCVVCAAPFAFTDWVWPADPATWIAFFLAGIAGLAAHQLMSIAYRFASPTLLSPFSYTELLALAVASWVVFNQPPDVWFYLGAPIIIGSGLYIWLRERQVQAVATPAAAAERAQ